jgi:hypothetical protein
MHSIIISMKLIYTSEAAGHILCHDMTEVIPGLHKKTRFRRGQMLTAADIPALLDMGKEQLYVWEKQAGMLHEEEGAAKLCSLCLGGNIRAAEVREGKVELFAEKPGLLKIDSEKLACLNSIDGVAIATLKGNRGVKADEKIAAVKIIPLLIEEEKLELAERIMDGGKLINIVPYKRKKAALIITGNEIVKKRISETGSEILRKKIEAFPAECAETVILPDDPETIAAKILEFIEKGLDLVICGGGMSVDPDDRTPLAIKKTGARIISYGVPFAPGFMLLLSYYEKNGSPVPVIGAPACVFYEHGTVLDLLLPRLMADDPVSREDLARLGEGGLG